MSKHIDIILTGPPALDFPSLVGAQDEHGQPVSVGRWLAPDNDTPFWRYRLTPAELLMYMIAGTQDVEGRGSPLGAGTPIISGHTESAAASGRNGIVPAPTSARAALKAKLANAKPKSTAATPAPDPALTEPCPACHQKFNPSIDTLVACSSCGEDKCSAKCFDNIAEPCLDCKALAADPSDPDDVAFTPPAKAKISDPELAAQVADAARGAKQAVASRLFDNQYHGKGGDSTAEDDDE